MSAGLTALLALALISESGRVPAGDIKRLVISAAAADLLVETASIAFVEWSGGEDVDFSIENKGAELRLHAASGDLLHLRLPFGRSLEVQTQSGDVTLRGGFADLSCVVTAGNLVLTGRARTVEIESLGGDFSMDGNAETLKMTSVSGGLSLRGSVGELRGRTTSGDLQIEGELPSRLQFQTVSGDIVVRGRAKKTGAWQLRTVSGDVHLGINGGLHLRAHTRSGVVTIGGHEIEETHFDRELRGGGLELDTSTFSGDIQVD
jgi:DUF4097 and DUF4098 domain-containing protein YvlB